MATFWYLASAPPHLYVAPEVFRVAGRIIRGTMADVLVFVPEDAILPFGNRMAALPFISVLVAQTIFV